MVDYRASQIGRRRSWYGLKKHVKRFLSMRIPHAVLRRIVTFWPGLRQSGRLPAPAHLKEVQGTSRGARFVMLRPDRCVVAKELYWGGGRRPKPQDAFAIDLFASAARHADVVLDIGAYTGIFTLVSAGVNPDLHVHAFEIVPDVYLALFENCVRNAVLHRTTLHHVGVGAPDATMRVPARSIDSALPDFYSSRLDFKSGVRVGFVSLDSIRDTIPAGSRVLVKVDVEGTENEVFRHGERFLSTFRPDVLCEVLARVADPANLEALLAPHGYRFYLVRKADLLPAPRIRPHATFRDWFFTTKGSEELAALGLEIAARSDAREAAGGPVAPP